MSSRPLRFRRTKTAPPAAPPPFDGAADSPDGGRGSDGGNRTSLPGEARRRSGSGMAALPGAAGPLDPWRLAGILVPGLGRGERAKLARSLGVDLAPHEPAQPAARLQEAEGILAAGRARLLSLDVTTLQRLARIFERSSLPEARLFEAAFRERARGAFDDVLSGAAGRGSASGPSDEEVLAPVEAPPPALQPARTRKPVDQGAVARALSPGGAVAASLPGYESRPGQVRMARAVAKALGEQLTLLVEAGTGTGKSLAYLLPAVEYAVANGRRVVVSTNTINLQEQLHFKDIPLLRRALPYPFRAAVLKGRANYLCLRRWRSFLRESVFSDPDRLLAAKILLWLRETESGDRNELALDEYETGRWSALLAADALHCTPKMCRDNRAGRCFLSRARRRAEAAHLLVVNHALLLADQALESKVLPEYADLILDEAHHLEDAATKQLGVEIDQQELAFFLAGLSQQQGPGRYAGLVARLQTALVSAGGPAMRAQAGELTQPAHDAVDEARRTLQEFFTAVTGFLVAVSAGPLAGEREVRLLPARRATPAWEAVEVAWEGLSAALGRADTALARLVDALEPFEGSAEMVDDALADLAGAQRQLAEVRTSLSAIVSHPAADEVYWVTARDRGIALRAAPLDVGSLLQQHLFSQKDSVVLTSATMQVAGSFRYVRERLGLDTSAYTLAIASPFDYARQALLCIPYDLPDPALRTFQESSHQALAALCEATGGRTLVLFTSHAALRAAHEHLRRHVPRVVVLGQGLDGPRQQLLERFRETPNAVLLGTSSFWEGIDVVGEALSCLVIVKLPFSVPSDPVFAARSELFDDPFTEYAVPQAVMRLKQGFGRLIRSGTDRGVVVVLDGRLWTKRYGAVFLRSLPPATQRRCAAREVADVAKAWLDQADQAGQAPAVER